MAVSEDTPLTGRPYQGVDVEHQDDSTFQEVQDIGRFRPTKTRVLLGLVLVAVVAVVGYSKGLRAETDLVYRYYQFEPYYSPLGDLAEDAEDIFHEIENDIKEVISDTEQAIKDFWEDLNMTSSNATSDNSTSMFDSILDMFDFFPKKKSHGHSIKKTNGTVEEMAYECFGLWNCTAFSTDGDFSQCQKSFDNFNASYNLVYMCNYWLGLRLDFLGGMIGAFIGAVSVATSEYNFIPAGWLGLALSYSIEVTGFLKHGVRMMATIEADMNSVERVLYYAENVEPEAAETVPEYDPKEGTWPTEGKIDIYRASMRYRDGPLVLKNIDVNINGGEKIGVVGRTGSGKSSLMNLLFRITELEKDGGLIKIDGVDTSKIGTEILRLNLSIIPQDPVMFSNTVRYNIDPFGAATETEIWEVLEKVQLAEVINALPDGLDDQVAEGGENFSQGQRQLLCIARSLLRKPKILIMDEATASIDNTTDAEIQKMIRENFKSATVLTIAHRLNTILDSDRILVLDDGNVAEFDSPSNLLAKPNGIFKGMVDKSRSVKEE